MRRLLVALIVALPGVVVLGAGGDRRGSVAEALPPGFADTTVTSSLSSLTTIEALPDGRMIALEKNGGVNVLDERDGSLSITEAIDFAVCTESERGLLGFTHDPLFTSSGTVYVFRTIPSGEPGGCHNRVSRFTMTGDRIDPASEFVLVDRISAINGNHNAGDIEIGNDGFLYIATGDAGRDPRGDSGSSGANDAGADRSLLNGKILRVDRVSGAPAPGNPFTGPGTAECRFRGNTSATPRSICQEIFATGLRNPFRFAFDPNTGDTRFFINDVGQSTREEVNDGRLGADYGWNAREGQCPRGQNPPCAGPPAGITDPIVDYPRTRGTFITAGAFVPDGLWPTEFDGAYLFGDGGFGRIYVRDAGGGVNFDAPFHTVSGGLVDMTFSHHSGLAELWYATSSGRVGKIVPPIQSASTDSGPLVFEPLPVIDRRYDSREAAGAAPIRGGTSRLIDIGAPADAVAAVVNMTYVSPASGGFVTPWLPRTRRPEISSANALAREVSANLAVLPLRDLAVTGDNGRALVFMLSTGHLVIDVVGYFVPAPASGGAVSAGRFEVAEPTRLADTRPGEDVAGEFARDGDRVTVPVVGRTGLPGAADEIDAVVVVVTGVNDDGAALGFATAHPTGSPVPNSSNVNINSLPDARANLAVVPVGDAGSIDVSLFGVSHAIVDVV
ncbi:MAG: PQQ-dependent sugar dehydrogenase, partial [Actinomycetota bacterium]